jgi:hypothetical protein
LFTNQSKEGDSYNEATVVWHLIVIEGFRMVTQRVEYSLEWLDEGIHPAHAKLARRL